MSALLLHRDVQPGSECGGQVADAHKLFGTDFWCVYCGKKWNADGTVAAFDA